QLFIHGYVLCSDVEGGIAHSCRHGSGPHNIKVCVVKKDNKDVWPKLVEIAGPKPRREDSSLWPSHLLTSLFATADVTISVCASSLAVGRGLPSWNPAPPPRRFQKGDSMANQRVTVWVQRFRDRPTLMLQWIDPDTGRRKSKSAETADEKEAEQKRV